MKVTTALMFIGLIFSRSGVAANLDSALNSFSRISPIEQSMLEFNLKRDQLECYPSLNEVKNLSAATMSNDFDIRGKLTYRKIKGGKYHYQVYQESGMIVVNPMIHFEGLDEIDPARLRHFFNNIKTAENIWNNQMRSRFLSNFQGIKFKFNVIGKKSDAYLDNVNLKDEYTRGPYFWKWSLAWPASTIAHEFGHVMGLDDEYDKKVGCPTSSIMCNGGSVLEYHLYTILRRVYCQD